MNDLELDPKVEKFKEFVQNKPELVQLVRAGKRTWQELFEDWIILGENDENWNEPVQEVITEKNDNTTKSEILSADLWPQILSYLKRLDINQIQDQLTNLGSTLTAVQGVVNQFQPQKPKDNRRRERVRPFGFRRD